MAIELCKPFANPHDSRGIPKYLPAGRTQYALNNFSNKSPPYHVTRNDVLNPLQRLEAEQITGHQSVRGRGGVIAVLYKTHWAEPSESFWEREMDLHLSRSDTCAIGPESRISTAKPTSFTDECGSGRHSASSPATTGKVSYRRATPVFPASMGSVATTTRYFLKEPTFGTRETMGHGGLEISTRALPRTRYTWSAFWTTRDRLNFLFPRRATRLRREPYETLGACKFTSTVRFLGESNVTWTNLEARPWSVDFQAATLLDSSSFFVVTRFESLSLGCS